MRQTANHHQHRRQHSNHNNIDDEQYDSYNMTMIYPSSNNDDHYVPQETQMNNNNNSYLVYDYLSDDESDVEIPAGCHLNVSQAMQRIIDQILNDSKSSSSSDIEFPSSLFCYERAYIRDKAKQLNLVFKTMGRGASRKLVLSKPHSIPPVSRKFSFIFNNLQLIENINIYLTKHPISIDDADALQSKIQKMPSSLNDWFYCSLLRSGNIIDMEDGTATCIPDRCSITNEQYLHYSMRNDMGSTRDNLLHLIESNKIVIVNGPPASGKSTRIPQYLIDDYYQRKWPIRILHSCTNSVSAHSLSNLLSKMKNETVGETIDCYTFDYDRVFPCNNNSLINITTHQYLLRTLTSGDLLFKSLTHLIIDDAHKRNHTLDMLFTYLKDILSKYRNLKIIFITTTMQYDLLAKYYGNVITYSIEPTQQQQRDKQEIFLEQILIDTNYMENVKCFSLFDCGLQLLDYWCQIATQQNQTYQKETRNVTCNNCQSIYDSFKDKLNRDENYLVLLIEKTFMNGLLNDFKLLVDFIDQHPHMINFQHPLTLVSPLMCVCTWSLGSIIEHFLDMNVRVNMRAINNFSAIDFARKYSRTDIVDLIESYTILDSLRLDQLLSLNDHSSDSLSQKMIKYYLQTRPFDDIIDYKLIILIIKQFLAMKRIGNILVFLPGLQEISKVQKILTTDFSDYIDIIVINNKSKWPFDHQVSHTRKVLILTDGCCETGVVLEEIGCVIDTGIFYEKCYDSLMSKVSPKYGWISKTSALERCSRLNVIDGGLCYRLYTHGIYDKMVECLCSEMARLPLQENIMQARLFSWSSCSIAEFMMKVPDSAPFHVVRSLITHLKSLELFDTWEDLVDMGIYCLALSIEPKYGKMIIYGYLFKCLEPILIIISFLIVGDPFQFPSNQKLLNSIRKSKAHFSSNKRSDHFVYYQLYHKWQKATNRSEFCAEWYVNELKMQEIDEYKTWLTKFLETIHYSHFFYKTNDNVNVYSSHWSLIESIIITSCSHNVITYDETNKRWVSAKHEIVSIDPLSSVVKSDSSSFVICDDIVRSNKGLSIAKCCTVISDIELLLIGTMPIRGNNSSIQIDHTTMSIKLNDHITFTINDPETEKIVDSLSKLRMKWNSNILKKLQSLGKSSVPDYDSTLELMVRVLSSRE